MIKIQSYAKAKGEVKQYLTGGFANTTINLNTGGNTTSGNIGNVNGIYLWGNYHDHTSDINGDLTSTGTVTANNFSGDSATISNINGTTANISGKATLGEIKSTYGDITTIDANTVNADLGKFENAQVTNTLTALNGIIDYLNSKEITTEYLTVTKAAHFFKLIIDEIKASQGQIVVTPANATIDKVVTLSNGDFKCYFRATDGDKKIYQSFDVNDQVVCQTFNAAEGTSYDVSNKFYWRLCTQVSTSIEQTEIDGNLTDCHWIVLSNTDKDQYSISVPEAGDEVVMLGNRNDSTRQSAITIGAYNNPYLDNTIKAPFIIQYAGINDYNLSAHRLNIISNGLNQFKGNFKTTSGDDIEQLIEDMGEGALTYVHQAYSNSSDGRLNFSKTYFDGALYVGFCSNHTESDSTLTYQDYTWARLKGENGDNIEIIKLVPVVEQLYVDYNDFANLYLTYNIVKQIGTSITTVTASTSGYYVRFLPINLNGQGSYHNLSVNTTSPTYSNNEYQDDWDERNDAVQYLIVELVKNNVVYDKRIVNTILSPAATLQITDSITATVRGNRNDINTNTNAISTLNQQFDSISATVRSHTTQLGTMQDEVDNNTDAIADITTDVANLEIRADGISAMVSKYTGVQLINPNGWTKIDGTAAEYNEDTQGYSTVYPNEGTNCSIFSNVVKLEEGKEYVFSYYPSIPNAPLSILYSSTNRPPSEFTFNVSTVESTLTDDTYLNHERHAFKFTATNSGYYVIKFGVTTPVTNAFYRPQLELGSEPTGFDLNCVMLSSQIVQTANNILLSVGNCGIDIDNNRIALNGDTEINGSLTLNDDETGFVLVGDGGTTIISPQSIGTYYEWVSKTYTQLSLNWSMHDNSYSVVPLSKPYSFTGTPKTIGYIDSGKTIVFGNMGIYLTSNYQWNGSNVIPMRSVNVTVTIYCDGTVVTTKQFSSTTVGNQYVFDLGTYTTEESGEYTISLYITNLNPNNDINYTHVLCYTVIYGMQIPYNIQMLIGYDGIGVNFSTTDHVYFGKNETNIRYDNAGIRISKENGLQKYVADTSTTYQDKGYAIETCVSQWAYEYAPINGCAVRKIASSGNGYLQPNDEFVVIVATSGVLNFYLGDPHQNCGRKVYFKKQKDGCTVNIYATNQSVDTEENRKILPFQNNADKRKYMSDDVNDENSVMYLCDGQYWIEFHGSN